MAGVVYPKALEAFGKAQIDLVNHELRLLLIDAQDYTYSSAHEFLSSVAGAARVADSGALAGKTVTNGIFTCTPPTFATVTGDQSEAMILVDWNGGADSARRLICYLDSVNYANLPVTPNGSSIGVTLPAGGIFQI